MTTRAPECVSSRTIGSNCIVYFDCGTGPVVVLIHGMFGDYLDWEPVLLPLSKRHRVIAVDLPGFGASDKPDRSYTVEFFTETLHELLHELGVGRAMLVGNSFGGEIAILYTLEYPADINHLILVDSGGFRHVPEEEQLDIAQRFNEDTLLALTPESKRQMLIPVLARASEQRERYLEKQTAKLKREDYPAYARAIVRSVQLAMSLYLLDRLPEITCPTLLLWGGEDQVIPLELARQALEKLPCGQLTVLPGCGHAPQLDCPEAFVRAVEGFTQNQ